MHCATHASTHVNTHNEQTKWNCGEEISLSLDQTLDFPMTWLKVDLGQTEQSEKEQEKAYSNQE